MQIDELEWLQNYYIECCDGDWEHTYGVKIDTLDNPGWFIVIDLNETRFEGISFEKRDVERAENDWFFCSVKDKKFQGCGGPQNLTEIIKIFRQWVEECDKALAAQG